jgi:hypothetical protein
MKIPEWCKPETQKAKLGRHIWHVSRLIQLAKDLPVMEVPLDHLYVYHKYDDISLREMVMHINAINNADLSCPIILDEDGEILDGRHRIMKAMLEGEKTIKAVRFEENPNPCEVEDV